jgi:hypothetical protein
MSILSRVGVRRALNRLSAGRFRVEQVDHSGIGGDVDRLPGPGGHAFAEGADDRSGEFGHHPEPRTIAGPSPHTGARSTPIMRSNKELEQFRAAQSA